MAELTQADIESKLETIDTQIANITSQLAHGDSDAAAYVDYQIGEKRVNASQILEQLIKTREMYQGLLSNLPTEKVRNVVYDVEVTGEDNTELVGDE